MGKQLSVVCGKCGKRLTTEERHIGRTATCPSCGAEVHITETQQGSSAPAGEDVPVRPGGMLKVTKQGDVGVVTFTTSRILDQSNVQQLGDEFNALLTDHKLKKIVLNFSSIGYLSSAVMGKLVNLLKKVQAERGDMVLCNIDSSIFEIFKIMRFDKLFKIHETEDQAVIDLMD